MARDELGYYNVVYIMVNGVIKHEMTVDDYRAVVDGIAPMQSLAGRACRCVLVALDAELSVQLMIAFSTSFDRHGFIDERWDLSFDDVLREATPREYGDAAVPLFDRETVPVRLSRWLWSVNDDSESVVGSVLVRVRENRLRFISVAPEAVLEAGEHQSDVPLLIPHNSAMDERIQVQDQTIEALQKKLELKESQIERLLVSVATLQSELTVALRKAQSNPEDACAFEDPTGVTVPFIRRSR